VLALPVPGFDARCLGCPVIMGVSVQAQLGYCAREVLQEVDQIRPRQPNPSDGR
jgi:hypothetical protein